MDRRDELLGWIAETKRLQRTMASVFVVLALLPIGLLFWSFTLGAFTLVCLALIAVCAFWVTAAHNAAHRQKLEELARVERNDGKPLQTAHRRWHS